MLKILQGNATEVLNTLPEESIDTIYTCPSPFRYYNNDKGKIGGELTIYEYIKDLVVLCNVCNRVLKSTGNLFMHLGDSFNRVGLLNGIPYSFEQEMRVHNWKLHDTLIWHRTEKRKRIYNEKGFLKNFEFIFHFVKDFDNFYFNTNSKWSKTAVFSYPLEDSFYTNEFDSGLPEQLSRIIIDTTCPPNGTILDPLCGSAKVGIVAKKMDRSFIGIDIDPKMVELCKIRLGLV